MENLPATQANKATINTANTFKFIFLMGILIQAHKTDISFHSNVECILFSHWSVSYIQLNVKKKTAKTKFFRNISAYEIICKYYGCISYVLTIQKELFSEKKFILIKRFVEYSRNLSLNFQFSLKLLF